MGEKQLDLFSSRGADPDPAPAGGRDLHKAPGDHDDGALLAAIPEAGVATAPALAAEAGRRRLSAAVPVLEALCRRFAGFGAEAKIPEQEAALRALGEIGGRPAAQAVARLIGRAAVQGPTLRTALAVASRLGAELPEARLVDLLRHDDPTVRAEACGCARHRPDTVPALIELVDDLHEAVHRAAACALGRIGRPEARPALQLLLDAAPSAAVIEALAGVADDDSLVLLGRLPETRPELTPAVLEALEALDSPRAGRLAAAIAARGYFRPK